MTDNSFPDITPAGSPENAADTTADITPAAAPGDHPTSSAESFPWSAEPTTEPTRTLPPFQAPVAAQPVAPAPARRGALTAGVLVGALLLGGAAGVAGAAWYDAWQGDESTSAVASTGTGVRASNAANLPAGSVEKVAATVLPSVVKINVSGNGGAGSGSGIVLTKDGQILTNNHVVDVATNGGAITVSLNDGRTVKAKVVGTDPVTDLAVIKAEGVDDLTPATIGSSDALQVGQAVVAVGSPYGLNATVTTGIVSALNRPVSVASSEQQAPQQGGQNPFGFNFGEEPQQQQQQAQPSGTTYPAIQTDAAINPGNSGGPLVDMSGRVVGINSSIRTAGDSSTGGSIGLGFSIPIDEVLPIVEQITDGQTPTHARLAISVSDVDANTLAQGAQVSDVVAGGAADKAGLKKGDVVTKVGDDLIDGSESLVATIRGHRPGEKVTITYIRDGKTQTTEATLGSDEESPKS